MSWVLCHSALKASLTSPVHPIGKTFHNILAGYFCNPYLQQTLFAFDNAWKTQKWSFLKLSALSYKHRHTCAANPASSACKYTRLTVDNCPVASEGCRFNAKRPGNCRLPIVHQNCRHGTGSGHS